MKYYQINENAARIAHEMNSMMDYPKDRATKEYRAYVDKAYAVGEERKAKYQDEADRIDYLCDLYARKLANWYNEHFRIEAMCPSIMISGGSNFPVRKKEEQNSRRESHHAEWEYVQKIVDRICSCGTDAIKSDDDRAIEKLELKIERLTDEQEMMKAVNAYYRKNKTLDCCPVLTEEQIEEAKAEMSKDWNISDSPYPGWALSSNNANIRRLKERLEILKEVKAAGTQEHYEDEVGVDGLKIVENTEAMRIQLIFDHKPDEETRTILKSYGFKWSPRFSAWQRVLNENGKSAARKAIEQIKSSTTASGNIHDNPELIGGC